LQIILLIDIFLAKFSKYDIMNTINEAKTSSLHLCIHCIGVKQADFGK